MSQIRLYIDEDAMSRRLVSALRLRAVDTITVADAGLIEGTDADQLRLASEQQRVLYSFNISDFSRLHGLWMASNQHHAGMVLVPQQRYSIGDQLRGLLRLVNARTAEEMLGRIEYLSNWV